MFYKVAGELKNMNQIQKTLQNYLDLEKSIKDFFSLTGIAQNCQDCQISAPEGDNKCCNSKKYLFNQISPPVENAFR